MSEEQEMLTEAEFEQRELRAKALECAARTQNGTNAERYINMAKEFEQYLRGEREE